MSSPDVLVVGAGPSGLLLALSLLQNGVSVRIIEKDALYHVGQRGAGVMPRTLEVFNLLGVLPDVLADSGPALPMQSYEMPGGIDPVKTWRMSPVEDPTPASPWPNAVMIAQSRTEAILRSHLRSFSSEVELSTSLVSFEQKADGVVATLVKSIDGEDITEIVQAKWLVGTDGARGVVRAQLGFSFIGNTLNEQLVIADVHLQGLDMHHIHVFGGGPSGTILIWPSERKEGDVMTVYIANPTAAYEALTSDYREFKAFVEERLARPDIVLGDCIWITHYVPNARMVDQFQHERVFLVGDAAHAHSLMGAQGLNTSIQDSFNLAWKLALVHKGISPRELLLTYTEERLPVIAEMLNITSALHNKTVAAVKGDEGPWKREGGLAQLGVNYRWSSIVIDKRAAHDESRPYGEGASTVVQAGDRAPDAPGLLDIGSGETFSLYQLFSSSFHTVLLFCPATEHRHPRLLASLKQYPADLLSVYDIHSSPESSGGVDPHGGADAGGELHDVQGHAHKNYAISMDRPTVIIVRPDGVIAAIVHGEEDCTKYFSRIFAVVEDYVDTSRN